MACKQIDCFKINMRFWKVLGIWPGKNLSRYYEYYSMIFVIIVVILYDLLFSINFYFLPRHLDIFIEEMIFYFTDLAVTSKVLTFYFMRDKIVQILITLESEIFQADSDEGLKIINRAKAFIKRYWKIVAVVSVTSNMVHILVPFIVHLFYPVKLELQVCHYSFISESSVEMFIYPLYVYQGVGMHFHMLYNLNIDTFFFGMMIFMIAQLDLLNIKLRNVTGDSGINGTAKTLRDDDILVKLNQCIVHMVEVEKYCNLIQDVFSATLFVQFSMASCIICVCLVRFTMPAPVDYYIFLATYMFVMIIQIMVPCWFGTRISDKSCALSEAIYDCDWTSKSRAFKSNLRILVERSNKPLSIIGGKRFPLSLVTFTSIINSAYSFFTLLQNMKK